jgi:hypothetical protein
MKHSGKLTIILAILAVGVLLTLGACGSSKQNKPSTDSSRATKSSAAATQPPSGNVMACRAVAAWAASGSQDTTPLSDAANLATNKNLADTINTYAANYKVLVVTGGDTSAADPSGSLAAACRAYGVTTGT